jgi:hypothetical protein
MYTANSDWDHFELSQCLRRGAVIDSIINKGAQLQAKAFRGGFSKVLPITDLQAFFADELVVLFGNSDQDWSVEGKQFLHSCETILLILPQSIVLTAL